MAVLAETSDRVIVVGAGIAGLATALHLAPMLVTLIAQARLGVDAATAWAQGGLAAALGADDTPELHAADTLAAGAGLSAASAALAVARAAPACIEWLERRGVSFDRDADGDVALGLEAAHARRRIVHAQGDGAGRIVLNALVRAVRALPAAGSRLPPARAPFCSSSSTPPQSQAAPTRCRSRPRRCGAKAPCSSMAAASGSWPTSRERSSRRGTSWRARSLPSSKRDSLCSSMRAPR